MNIFLGYLRVISVLCYFSETLGVIQKALFCYGYEHAVFEIKVIIRKRILKFRMYLN